MTEYDIITCNLCGKILKRKKKSFLDIELGSLFDTKKRIHKITITSQTGEEKMHLCTEHFIKITNFINSLRRKK